MLIIPISHYRDVSDGTRWYLVKWRELPYDQSTWETEGEIEIPELELFISMYHDLRYVLLLLGLFPITLIMNTCI